MSLNLDVYNLFAGKYKHFAARSENLHHATKILRHQLSRVESVFVRRELGTTDAEYQQFLEYARKHFRCVQVTGGMIVARKAERRF
jgi:hypothetical protein